MEPSCEELEEFADALVDTGITYDYEPSSSPVDLASSADAVLGGRLTGRISIDEVGVEEGRDTTSFIGYEVEITRLIEGPAELAEGDLVEVYIEYGPQHRGSDYYAEAVTSGAPVAVFAFDHEPLGELTASIEGFMTSCADGPLLGWFGAQDEWASVQTVDEVLDAVARATTSTGSPAPTPSAPEGATAVWRIDDRNPPSTSSTSFTALVTRLECSGGETGDVLAPIVSSNEDEVTVTFAVKPLPPGGYDCPGNNEVPYVVELNDVVGERTLVDGACVAGEAVATTFCLDGSARWTP